MYELHNAGAMTVHYQVDVSVLSQLQTDNFNHPVLRCLNPKGTVLPGETAVLEWIFSPLEAKLYQVRTNTDCLFTFKVIFFCCWCNRSLVSPDGRSYSCWEWRHHRCEVWRLWVESTRTQLPEPLRQQWICGIRAECAKEALPRAGEISTWTKEKKSNPATGSLFFLHFFVLFLDQQVSQIGVFSFFLGLCLLCVRLQLVFLSEDSISFGDIPVCSRSSRLLFLINLSPANTLHYTWDKSHQQVRGHIRTTAVPCLKCLLSSFSSLVFVFFLPQLIEIQPEEGTLSPGETVLFVLTFISSEHPTCYQFDVFCQVANSIRSSHAAHVIMKFKSMLKWHHNCSVSDFTGGWTGSV